jgi:uncharacterized protein (TIGR01777 family)
MARWAVAGATGLVGTRLVERLRARGDEVVRLVRRNPSGADDRAWDPGSEPGEDLLEGIDGVLNLAGSSIASGLWTAAGRREVRESRLRATRNLVRACERAGTPVLVNASAVGYYGDRGDEFLDESSLPGNGFLAEVCGAWEAAASPAGTRLVKVRFGSILSPRGGALEPLRSLYRLGLGGPIGGGRQWFPWIDLEDATGIVMQALDDDDLSGPLVAVSPGLVRQAEFARELGRSLHRPARAPLPALLVRALPGPLPRTSAVEPEVRLARPGAGGLPLGAPRPARGAGTDQRDLRRASISRSIRSGSS